MIFAVASGRPIRRVFAAASLLACVLTACAKPPAEPAARAGFERANDPLEPLNRKILAVNMVFDKAVLRPVAKTYVTVLPDKARDAIHHMLTNLGEPVTMINNVLEGRGRDAGITAGRFVLNTTVGVGGLVDVAQKMGIKRQPADFGQTLYVWGVPRGPYLVLPILGPSNPRDGIGMGVDAFLDPLSYVGRIEHVNSPQIGRFVLSGVDRRAQVLSVLDDLEKNSLDFYSELRSLSEQQRAAELNHGKAPQPGADFYNDPGRTGPPPASPLAPAPAVTPTPPPAPAAMSAPTPTPAAVPAAVSGPPQPIGTLGAEDADEGPLRRSASP